MNKSVKILNKNGERLDVLIEGNLESKVTIVFVHGLGVTKDESFQYFVDISKELQSLYRIVRFALSGYGLSEGKQEDANYIKHADDLDKILKYIRTNIGNEIYLLAHSMGCFVTSLLSPEGVTKSVFTGLPNHNVEYLKGRLIQRILGRKGSLVNLDSVTIFPRSTGEVQKIGSSFWQVLSDFNPLQKVTEFSQKTSLLIIHPAQDDVVGIEYLEKYRQITTSKTLWLPGDHSFQKMDDRNKVIESIKDFYKF